MRFDVYLAENDFFDSRNKAAAAIKSGSFSVNGKTVNKPSYDVTESDAVEQIKELQRFQQHCQNQVIFMSLLLM